jgi:hypothetical protein
MIAMFIAKSVPENTGAWQPASSFGSILLFREGRKEREFAKRTLSIPFAPFVSFAVQFRILLVGLATRAPAITPTYPDGAHNAEAVLVDPLTGY